jgi:mono/diheme cytochrome c family protein
MTSGKETKAGFVMGIGCRYPIALALLLLVCRAPGPCLLCAQDGAAGKAGGDPAVPAPERATFSEHVFPILKEHCAGCHGGERPKGRLDMESLGSLERGGKKGPPVIPGKPEESLIYRLISGAGKPSMPPKDEEPLTPGEIATIHAWILGGARPGEAAAAPAPYSLPLKPTVYSRPAVVTALAYSSDGNLLFVSGYREILLHEVASAGAHAGGAASLKARFPGESERILALALSPDGKLLAAAGGNPGRFGEVQLWDLAQGKLRRFFRIGKDTLFAIAFSPDGKRLAAGGTDRAIHLLDLENGGELYAVEIHSDWIFGLAFTADGSRLASASRDKTVKVCTAADGKFLQTLATSSQPLLRLVGRPGTALSLAGGEEAVPVLYDAQELKETRKFEAQPGAILAAAISSDGKLLALGGSGKEIRVYQLDGGARKAAFTGLPEWVYALAFRPDGERLAAAGYDGLVRIYDLKEGKEAASFVPVPVEPGEAASAARSF